MAEEPKMTETTTPSAATAEKPKPQGESWVETVKTVVYALLIAAAIRTFLFQPFNIPSGSMENTLLVGDYLFVEKYAYGFSRYSFPFGLGPIPEGRIFGSEPHRGDVESKFAGLYEGFHQARDRIAGRPHPDDCGPGLSKRQAGAEGPRRGLYRRQ
jgi:hypothetical protein